MSATTITTRGSCSSPPEKAARCVSCQSTSACSISTTVTCSTRLSASAATSGEADAEPADQHIVRCGVALQRGVDEQPFGMSVASVHQERAVADDLEVVADPTKHELAALGRDPGDDRSATSDMRGAVSGGSDARPRGRARRRPRAPFRRTARGMQRERGGHVEGHLAPPGRSGRSCLRLQRIAAGEQQRRQHDRDRRARGSAGSPRRARSRAGRSR